MNYANMSEDEYSSIVINRLVTYMKKNGVRQLDLARVSNINQSTLSKILSGESKLTLSHIFKICTALSIDPEILLSFDHDIASETLHLIDAGVINKSQKYLDDQIFIRSTNHPAFKGYINNKYEIYMYSTISSESSLLKGSLSFEDTEYHNYCKATLTILTGQKNSDDEDITKIYSGELLISLTMGACYTILLSPELGEIVFINFKHFFLFNNKLVCRVGTVISSSSGTNRLPIMQRILITDRKLDADDYDSPDSRFIRGQLKLNDSGIVLEDDSIDIIKNIAQNCNDDLKYFLEKCINNKEYYNTPTFYVFDETKLRSIDVPLNIKAEGISILRDLSVSPKYNKVSTKTEEFTFQYINRKKNV